FSLLSMVQPAMCGDKITFSAFNKYWNASGSSPSNKCSNDDFSYSKTSSPAPITLPELSAETKSEVTTFLPREVLMSQNGFANELINSSFTILSVWFVQGMCRLKTSAFCFNSSSGTCLAL